MPKPTTTWVTRSKSWEGWKKLRRLEQAIALKPDYAEAHNNLGITLRELGKLDEAEASYRKAIALKPDAAGAHSTWVPRSQS